MRDVRQSTETQFVYVDGHSSHFSEKVFALAEACGFVLIFLPAHMSSRLQPADTGLNAAFKAIIRRWFESMMGLILFLELSLPLLNGVSRARTFNLPPESTKRRRRARRSTSQLGCRVPTSRE